MTPSLVGLGLLAFAGVAWWLWSGSQHKSLRWRWRRLPQFPLAVVPPDAVVRTVGKVAAIGETLVAPLTKRRCVYYEVSVFQSSWSRNPAGRRPLFTDCEGCDFRLVSGKAEAVVAVASSRPVHLDLFPLGQYWSSTGPLSYLTPDMEAVLARHGMSARVAGVQRRLDFYEAVIAPGEGLVVAGRGRWEPKPAPPFLVQGEPERTHRLVFRGEPDAELVVVDAPKVVAEQVAEHNRAVDGAAGGAGGGGAGGGGAGLAPGTGR